MVEMINTFVTLQRTTINKSFEDSRLWFPIASDTPLLRYLRGRVSLLSISILVEQKKIMLLEGFKESICICKLRSSFGLPCAHDIANSNMEQSGIPLSLIDPFWKKLDVEGQVEEVIEQTPQTSTLEEAIKVIKNSPKLAKQVIALVNIDSPDLKDPKSKKHKGRPKGSTKRLPSHFEFIRKQFPPKRKLDTNPITPRKKVATIGNIKVKSERVSPVKKFAIVVKVHSPIVASNGRGRGRGRGTVRVVGGIVSLDEGVKRVNSVHYILDHTFIGCQHFQLLSNLILNDFWMFWVMGIVALEPLLIIYMMIRMIG